MAAVPGDRYGQSRNFDGRDIIHDEWIAVPVAAADDVCHKKTKEHKKTNKKGIKEFR
ncbi:MAG: hypothetical protein MJE77_01385 [Proteobacteria bacterium]|nr:hypothetical protein [Pseudomonadota bacterium]